jgi:hypothetical protein
MNGLYPIIRRVRRSLVPLESAPAAPAIAGKEPVEAARAVSQAETPPVPEGPGVGGDKGAGDSASKGQVPAPERGRRRKEVRA